MNRLEEKLKKALEDIIRCDFTDDDLFDIHNKYCDENYVDNHVYFTCEETPINTLFAGCSPYEVLQSSQDFSFEDNFYYIDDEKLISFNNIDDKACEYSEYARYWIDNPNEDWSFDYSDNVIDAFCKIFCEIHKIDKSMVKEYISDFDAEDIVDNIEKFENNLLERIKDETR